MQINLTGKTALVTGASRGIGREIATQMGEAGATIAVHYRSKEAEAREVVKVLGKNSRVFQADMTKSDQVSQLFSDVSDAYGSVDILVNNAGLAISSPVDAEDTSWLDDWNKTLLANLTSAALLSKKFVQHCIKNQGQGRLINITSRAAYRGDTEDYLAYAASKAGLAALTSSLARAYGKKGITAFNLAPGFVQTDMAQDFLDQYGENYALSDISMPTLTQPADIARFVVFLASGFADHALGSSIHVNAGSYIH
mgnify:CR=1 FL=1